MMKFKGTGRPQSVWRVGLAGLVFALATGAGSSAFAQHGPGGMGMGGPGGSGFGPMMFGGPPEHQSRMIDQMLDGLSATDAQRAQIKSIAQAAATDMKAQHDAGRALHDKAAQVFTAPNVDAGAAEQVRQQMLAQQDQMSRRTLAAMLDISRVLTPDQRAKLGERARLSSDAMRERAQRMDRQQSTK